MSPRLLRHFSISSISAPSLCCRRSRTLRSWSTGDSPRLRRGSWNVEDNLLRDLSSPALDPSPAFWRLFRLELTMMGEVGCVDILLHEQSIKSLQPHLSWTFLFAITDPQKMSHVSAHPSPSLRDRSENIWIAFVRISRNFTVSDETQSRVMSIRLGVCKGSEQSSATRSSYPGLQRKASVNPFLTHSMCTIGRRAPCTDQTRPMYRRLLHLLRQVINKTLIRSGIKLGVVWWWWWGGWWRW